MPRRVSSSALETEAADTELPEGWITSTLSDIFQMGRDFETLLSHADKKDGIGEDNKRARAYWDGFSIIKEHIEVAVERDVADLSEVIASEKISPAYARAILRRGAFISAFRFLFKRRGEEAPIPIYPLALWQRDRRPKENPVEFIRWHYAPWLNKGLTRAHILNLDKPLYKALSTWIMRHGEPSSFNLLTKKQENDRQPAEMAAASEKGDTMSIRDMMRLTAAARRRMKLGEFKM